MCVMNKETHEPINRPNRLMTLRLLKFYQRSRI